MRYYGSYTFSWSKNKNQNKNKKQINHNLQTKEKWNVVKLASKRISFTSEYIFVAGLISLHTCSASMEALEEHRYNNDEAVHLLCILKDLLSV